MKVFSKEKYLAQPFSEYFKEVSLRSGWVDECDGKPVIDGRCGCFLICDNWCIDVPDKKKEKKKMYTMQDFIEKKIAVRTGTGEKQRKFLEPRVGGANGSKKRSARPERMRILHD